jgi:hypothetical protein
MRITIRGLTQKTITFNSLGFVLRGAVVAKSIEIKNDEQLRELNSVKNSGLIAYEREDLIPSEKEISTTLVPLEEKSCKRDAIKIIKSDGEIEDAPTKPTIVVAKKQRGRPKGSLNKKVETKKTEGLIKNGQPSEEDNSQVTIMTPGGVVKGRLANANAAQMKDSDATRASLDAMEKIEEEERQAGDETTKLDENDFDISDRMGLSATISTGMGTTQKISMKKSLLPEAEAINNAKKFIDDKDSNLNEKDDNSKNAFIDEKDDNSEKTMI